MKIIKWKKSPTEKNYSNQFCIFDIPQIALNPFCIGLNLSILTRSGCYGPVPRENFAVLGVGPTLTSVELVIGEFKKQWQQRQR